MVRLLILHAAPHAGPNILKSLQQIHDASLQIDLFGIPEPQTLTLEQLLCYDVILFDSTHRAINTTEIGNVLHDFVVVAGKGLVICVFSNRGTGLQCLGGKFMTGNVNPMHYGELNLESNEHVKIRPASFHPLLNHVHDLQFPSASRVVAPVTHGAHRVAQWNNGNTLVSYKQQYTSQGIVVCLNMVATCVRNGDSICIGWDESSDGHWLLYNSVMFAANKTLLTMFHKHIAIPWGDILVALE